MTKTKIQMKTETEKFEVKFRGIRVDNSEMVFGFYRKNSFYNRLGDEPKLIYTNHFIGAFDNLSNFDGLFEQVVVIPETVGQFTGLKDKNGVEIYEGDVIYVNDYGVKINGVIIRDEVRTGFKIDWTKRTDFNEVIHVRIDKIEVIGNIHQNPELLNLKKP